MISKKEKFKTNFPAFKDKLKVFNAFDIPNAHLFSVKDNRIIQGTFGDCAFVAVVIALLVHHKSFIFEKFLFDLNPAHYLCVSLFIAGKKEIIEIDDRIILTE